MTQELKTGTTVQYKEIGGKTYSWVDVGSAGMDIKILASHFRETNRAGQQLTEAEKFFHTGGHFSCPSWSGKRKQDSDSF